MKNQKKNIYPEALENYVASDPESPRISKAPATPSVSKTAAPQKYESKSSLLGLINHANQFGEALGLTNPARRKKVIGISLIFLALMALVIHASPSSSSPEKDKERSSIGILTDKNDEARAGQDVRHFMEDKRRQQFAVQQQPQTNTMTSVSQPIRSPRQESNVGVHEVIQAPPPEIPVEPDPGTMLVYLNKTASTESGSVQQATYIQPLDGTGTQTFIKGKLISNIEASNAGGPLAIGQLEDGRIVYGNALMSPDIDRIYINFSEEQSPEGARRSGLHYVVTDKQKTQGLPAKCSDIGKGRNLIAKSLSIGYNTLSAVAGATSTRAYSAQDAARERVALQLQNEASYADQSGRVRFCSVNAGAEFFIVITGAGR
jgi:hypothetical protein